MFFRSAFRRSLYLACAHAGLLSACASSDDADSDTTPLVNTTSSTDATASAPTGANPGPATPAVPTPSAGPASPPTATGPAATPPTVTTTPITPASATVPGSNTNVDPTPSEPASGSGGAGDPGLPSANPTGSEPTSSAPSNSGGAPPNTGGASPEQSGGAPTSQGGDASSAGSPANNGGAGNSGPSDAPFTRAETVRVMAFGDSTTATGDWRRRFWDKLQAAGYTNIDMVGSGNDGSGNFDGDNEGHSGVLVNNVTQGEIEGWATTNPADVVLFHWATNDVWSNIATNTILDAYGRMVQGLRVGNPNVIVLVAKIIPVAPPTCGDCPARTVNLNDAIPAWAEMTSSAASPVLVIDQWTGFDPATGTEDGVHPYTAIGAQHIADNWYDALLALYQD